MYYYNSPWSLSKVCLQRRDIAQIIFFHKKKPPNALKPQLTMGGGGGGRKVQKFVRHILHLTYASRDISKEPEKPPKFRKFGFPEVRPTNTAHLYGGIFRTACDLPPRVKSFEVQHSTSVLLP